MEILIRKNKHMNLKESVTNLAEQFNDTDASEIQAYTEFHKLDEWGGLAGMGVTTVVKTIYGKTTTGKEVHECTTVEDLSNLAAEK